MTPSEMLSSVRTDLPVTTAPFETPFSLPLMVEPTATGAGTDSTDGVIDGRRRDVDLGAGGPS